MRLIDADELMKSMYHRAFETDGDTMWQSGCWVRYRAIEEVVKARPTIKPMRKKGEWIPVEVKGVPYGIIMKCNKCNFETMVNDALYFNYCPNCGWQMMRGDTD